MKTFHELYLEILAAEADKGRIRLKDYNPYHMDCLLHPENYAPVVPTQNCKDCAFERACEKSCVFDAICVKEDGSVLIDAKKCAGCGVCIDSCKLEHLAANRDVLPVLRALREGKREVYAMIAPAFVGQLEKDVTPGRLRAAFKALGFTGMVEVAVFADILTLKEALEFDRHINDEKDFQLTSCCCPVWIAMIRKVYKELLPHVPGAVSPMIAAGRVIKKIHPDAMTVFIGPCMAKKKEAREPDIADAVDYVLTFQEVLEIFEAAEIHPKELAEDEKEHSSRAGRIYARTGGVSEAVSRTVEQLNPDRKIGVRAEQADGVPACRALIARIQNGETDANFFEGMGCNGGCVGGPKAVIDRERGREYVNAYGEEAAYRTPLENPYVMELLARLGFLSVEDFLENSDLFARDFT